MSNRTAHIEHDPKSKVMRLIGIEANGYMRILESWCYDDPRCISHIKSVLVNLAKAGNAVLDKNVRTCTIT